MRLKLINFEDKKKKPIVTICFDKTNPIVKEENLNLIKTLKDTLYLKENRNLLLKLRYYNQFEEYTMMINTFKENENFKPFFKEPNLLGLIQHSINDYDLPNVKALKKEVTDSEIIYTINFEFGFFDSLQKSTLDILEKIFNATNKDDRYKYINKNFWIEYAKNYKEIIDFGNDTHVTNRLKIDYSPDEYSLIIPKDDTLPKNTEYYYEDTVSNEEQLLYAFLGMIFSFNKINPIIKKCESCGKFFIANKSDTLKCNREDENGYTCNKQAIIRSKAKYKDDFVHSMEKRIRDLYKSNSQNIIEKRNSFMKDYPIKRIELSGRNYLYWLASHYTTEETRKKWEKEIDKYINAHPNFENGFQRYKRI